MGLGAGDTIRVTTPPNSSERRPGDLGGHRGILVRTYDGGGERAQCSPHNTALARAVFQTVTITDNPVTAVLATTAAAPFVSVAADSTRGR